MILIHKDLVWYFYQLGDFHSSEALKFLEFPANVSVWLGHKHCVDHSLVFWCFWCFLEVHTWMVSHSLSQKLDDDSFGFWIIVVVLDMLVGFLAPTKPL